MDNNNFKPNKISKFDIYNYEIIKTIYVDSISIIKLCKSKKDNTFYLIKMFSKSYLIHQKQVDHIYSEYQILSLLSSYFFEHNFSFLGINVDDPRYLFYLFKNKPHITLFNLLNTIEYEIQKEQLCYLSAQIIKILIILHSKNIIFRYLIPENVIICHNFVCKIKNFSYSKIVLPKDKAFTFCGIPEYMAPELIIRQGHNRAVDWWSLGILLYEICYGHPPFTDDDPIILFEKILNDKIELSNEIEPNVGNLIKHLTEKDLTRRYGGITYGINYITKHKFFNGIDWKGLWIKNYKIETPQLNEIIDKNNIINNEKCNFIFEAEYIEEKDDVFLSW